MTVMTHNDSITMIYPKLLPVYPDATIIPSSSGVPNAASDCVFLLIG